MNKSSSVCGWLRSVFPPHLFSPSFHRLFVAVWRLGQLTALVFALVFTSMACFGRDDWTWSRLIKPMLFNGALQSHLLYGQFYPTMGCLRVSNSLWFVTDGVNFSFLRWCDQPFEIEYSTEAHWGLTTKGNRGKQTYFWSFTLDNLLVSSLLRV